MRHPTPGRAPAQMPDPYSANYCLTSSDLSGLYRLYPLCSGAKRTPGCLRSKNNVGYLRLGLAFGARAPQQPVAEARHRLPRAEEREGLL